ncbi:MAG TPA: hypothetical protein ENK05_02775 [Gammaproteobacteria bacterium]|nr:hypothetical protein [Gammaproteobacteria bacterium]
MGAIDNLEQLGGQMDTSGEKGAPGGEGAGNGERPAVILMDKLLEQVEGNPAYLMKNQFMLEEQRLVNQQGRRLYEPRPW